MPHRDPPNRQHYGFSHPVDSHGYFTKNAFYKRFLFPEAENKPTVVLFAGSRYGNGGKEGIYAQEAQKIDLWLTENNIWAITGGAPPSTLGLMSKVVHGNPYRIGVCPYIFADRKHESSGLHPDAINLLTYDFPQRKPAMGVLSDQGIMLPGGYGSLEEGTEYFLQGVKDGKPLHILNMNGFYDSFFSQFGLLESLGMMPRNVASWTLSTNAEMLCDHVDNHFRGDGKRRRPKSRDERIRSERSLQSYLHDNPNIIADAVEKFAGWDAPRIGMLASGNIHNDSKINKLRSSSLTQEFVAQAAIFGQRVAERGGVLVLTGSTKGLREIAAKAALDAGGKVIWIQKDSHKETLSIRSGDTPREMIITVTREHEKMAAADLVVESCGVLAGGMHTLDRTLEMVTRNQTGCNGIFTASYMTDRGDQTLVAETLVAGRKRPVVIGINIGGMWDPIIEQIEVCNREGFLGSEPDKYGMVDRDLLRMLPVQDTSKMVDELMHQARPGQDSYDLLRRLQIINANIPRAA